MKAVFTLMLSLLLGANIWACSFNTTFFCQGVGSHNLVYGKILDSVPHGVKLEVLHVYSGTETRDTITVWESFFWCMDTTFLPTSLLGQIGDTVFISLPIVDSSIHGWDIVGDYRINNIYERASILNVNNDTVYGHISGYAGFVNSTYKLALSSYLQWYEVGSSCSQLITVGVSEVTVFDAVAVYPNPTNDYVAFRNLPIGATVELLSLNGQHISAIEPNAERIYTAHLAAGTYLLKINYQGETGFRRVVKL